MAVPVKIIYGVESRQKILDGVQEIADAVTATLGPKGANVLIDDKTPRPLITKDGVTVAKSITFSDSYKRVGAALVKEAAARVDDIAGDGTTTTTLIISELLKKTAKLAALGFDRTEIRKGVEAATKSALAYLEEHKTPVRTLDDIYTVAKVSANGNEEIASKIKEAYSLIGDNGTVHIAHGNNVAGETYVESSDGLDFDSGLADTAFVNAPDGTATFEYPKILVMRETGDEISPYEAIMQLCKSNSTPLVIVAPNFSDIFMVRVKAKMSGTSLQMALVYSPGLSFQKARLEDYLADLSAMLDTDIYTPGTLSNIKTLDDLGDAELIKASVKRTTITAEVNQDSDRYKSLVSSIKSVIDTEGQNGVTPEVIEAAKDRLARLTGGVAIVRVGALTPTELEEKLALYEDASRAVETSIEFGGVLPGGGTAMLRAADFLKKTEKKHRELSDTAKKGYEAVAETLREPAKKIIASVDNDNYQLIMSSILRKKQFSYGYNARAEKITDMLKDGIIDAYAVEHYALAYSSSIAQSFIATDCVVTPEDENVRVNYETN